jgi:metallo-beta-lactamase family protein
MKVTFLGAAHQVTGSCTLVEWKPGRYLIVDYGMEQGVNTFQMQDLPVPPARIEYVFLTHAHIDHSGRLPLLYKNGFRGVIYATQETVNLSRIMLADSAHIQETDAATQTKKNLRTGGPVVTPLYTVEDAENVMKCFLPCAYNQRLMIDEGLSARFTDAGHLLGSSFVELFMEDNGQPVKMVFSGDVGNIDQPIIKDPTPVKDADYLLIESTYGARDHEKAMDPIPLLVEILRKTFSRHGTVIIPSFAVGRTQELLYFFRIIKQQRLLPEFQDFPVYLDSPLANEATAIFLQCDLECLDEDTREVLRQGKNPIWFEGLKMTTSAEESKALNDDDSPKVIIASGGMCDGGRIRHHLKNGIWNKRNTILFTGYQAVGTLGRIIYDGVSPVNIMGEKIDVNADIQLLAGLSGHADRSGLLRWVDQFEKMPKRIFVNHGDDVETTAFVKTLTEKYNIPAEAPWSGSSFDLLTDQWIVRTEPVLREGVKAEDVEKVSEGGKRNQTLYAELTSVAEELNRYVRSLEGHSNRELEQMVNRIRKLLP